MNVEEKVRELDTFQAIGALLIAVVIVAHTLLIGQINNEQNRLMERVEQLEKAQSK